MKLRIWEERTKKNVSLTQLSMRTGISKGALDNYENGKRYPNLEQMEKMSRHCTRPYPTFMNLIISKRSQV